MPRKRSLKEGLIEFLETWDDDDGGGGEDDDVITLRGPSARALLGILSDGGEGKPAGDDEPEGKPAGDGDPAGEPAPQRAQSRYFGEK